MPRLVWIHALAALLLLAAARAQPLPGSGDDAAVPVAWFELALELVRETPGFSPPVASRAFGYLGVALYEAVAPGVPGARSLAGQLNGLDRVPAPAAGEAHHGPAVANAALARLSGRLFASAPPERRAAIARLEADFRDAFVARHGERRVAASAERGRAVADAIWAWSRTDGGHDAHRRNFSESYRPPAGAGSWVSTPPAFERALQPTWGDNRPFALANATACAVAPPPAYSEESSSEFYRQAREVYDTGRGLDAAERAIAVYWADDPGRTATPPGHWISILNQLLVQRDEPLERAAEAYARLGIALADAFIACWDAKYRFNLIRPISYIRRVIDADWNAAAITDAVLTPPFPEYPSGHSVASGAAAQVLTALFGEVAFTDHTHDALGLAPRAFPSFFAAAEEAAISRLYGGIHFRAAIENGLDQGRCIGLRVGELRLLERPAS